MDFIPLLSAFLASLTACHVIIRTSHLHGHLTTDGTSGAQKIHHEEVPRVGGLAVGAGVLVGGVLMSLNDSDLWYAFALCALPAFIAGFWEDITKRVSVKTRLAATILAGMTFSMMTGYAIRDLGIPYVDTVLAVPVIALVFTGFAMGGVANALNIIDGCNGLASGTAIVLLAAFGTMAWQVGDTALVLISMTTLFATAGFFALNFPLGRIFLGDAGAYSIGFLLAALAVALPARNPALSPVIGLLVLIYPVSETIYSITRRLGDGHRTIGQPDRKHLHSLVFRALEGVVANKTRRNSASSIVLWSLPLVSAAMAVALAKASTEAVLVAAGVNALIYRFAYYAAMRVS